MREITTQFLGATYFTVQDPTRLLKLFQLLQIIVKNLTDTTQKLKKIAKSKIKENEQLKLECAKSKAKGLRGVQCPICQKMFVSLQYVDSHIFTRHPEQATIWQALRTPQYPGLTKTYDPITSQAYIHKMLEKMTEELSYEAKSSELDIQLYFKKQLHKMKKQMKKKSRKEKDPVDPDPPEKEEVKPPSAPLIIPVQDIQYAVNPIEEEESEEEGEVQVTLNPPVMPLEMMQQEPVTESQKVFMLSDSHVSDVIPVNGTGTDVGPSVLVMPVSSSETGIQSSSMENVNLQSWKPTKQAMETIEEEPKEVEYDSLEDGIYF